jgi:predicted ATPase/DNA-binding SARP family transcriptional activator
MGMAAAATITPPSPARPDERGSHPATGGRHSARMEPRLELRVLGSVEAVRGGQTLRIGGRRQRALLALLVLEAGRSVPADRLIDELWRGDPPGGASTLPSYVSRLRTVLGPTAIASSASGYAIDVKPDEVDAFRFERLIAEGRRFLAAGRPERAAEQMRLALQLWRGRPFEGLADEGALRAAAERLEELRLSALEDRIQADLDLGATAEVVDELEGLVRAYPYRERLWGELMLALYRGQRQADALGAYQRARRALADELGLEPSKELDALQAKILRQDVGLSRQAPGRHNLPAAVTTFIGRTEELGTIEALLASSRLVTLTGVGGVGKTRLALEVATRAIAEFRDGVFLVDLSTVVFGSLVARQIGIELGIGDTNADAALESVVAHTRDARLLLVLDNCEHVRAESAAVVTALLRASAGPRVLATSRQTLGAEGETDLAIAPLRLGDPTSANKTTTETNAAEWRQSDAWASVVDAPDTQPLEPQIPEAVQLFLARAAAARPSLRLDQHTVSTAAQICADLDGLPLAIELAAARAKALSLEQIAAHVSDRFRFLVSWRRVSPARHQTLREAMDWSFELLAPSERELFARLSVFAGGFTIEAAAAVCLDGDEALALELLERLVAASLIVPVERDGEMRYRLLETVRQYAALQLPDDAAEPARRAHATYFLKVAESADLAATRSRPNERLDVASAAQDNLRGALAWALDRRAVEFGLELATSLERFWVTHDPSEGIRWFAAFFGDDRAPQAPARVRANALRAYGGSLGIAGRDADAARVWRESLSLFVDLGDQEGEAILLHRLAVSAMTRHELPEARRLADRSLALHQALGNRWGMAQVIGTLGAIHRDEGDERRATELIEQSGQLARELGSGWWETGTIAELGHLALNGGQLHEGERLARVALRRAAAMRDRPGMVFGVGLLARVAAERGEKDVARRLWGAVEGERLGSPLGGWRHHRAAYGELLAAVAAMPAANVERATLDDAVVLALRDFAAGGPAGLTTRRRCGHAGRRRKP